MGVNAPRTTSYTIGNYGARSTLAGICGFAFYRYRFGMLSNTQQLIMVEECSSCSAPNGTCNSAHYDNSDGNPNNPDPEAEVHWGDQTWEEMFVGYYDSVIPLD